MVIWFPSCNVRSKCECAHIMQVGMTLVVRPYVYHYRYTVESLNKGHFGNNINSSGLSTV